MFATACLPKPSEGQQYFTFEGNATPTLGRDEIAIKNEAIGIVDLDVELQYMHEKRYPSRGPPILGQSVAGVIVDMGTDVTRFHKGQRVMAHCHALRTRNLAHAGFQHYSVALKSLTASIPGSMSFATAATFPYAISTAAAALYEKTHLNLPLTPSNHEPSKEALLVITGSSSIGIMAIQLAMASGLRVIAAGTKQDLDRIQRIRPDVAIDIDHGNAYEGITAALAATRLVGIFDTASNSSSAQLTETLLQLPGERPRICCVRPLSHAPVDYHYTIAFAISILRPLHEFVCKEVWGKRVPELLRIGTLRERSPPHVTGTGLGALGDVMQSARSMRSLTEETVVLV